MILQALFFFLPAYLGNAVPVIVAHFRWFESWNKAIDGGKKLSDGEFLFGSTKTWRGLAFGALAGMLTGLLQAALFAFFPVHRPLFFFPYGVLSGGLLGLLLGLGEGLGDLFKSFLKRRLHYPSSSPFFGFDQLSFLGALALGSLIYTPPLLHIFFIAIFSVLLPIIANMIAYKLGWKKVWW